MSTSTNGTPSPNDPEDNVGREPDAAPGDHSPSTSDGDYAAPQFGGAAAGGTRDGGPRDGGAQNTHQYGDPSGDRYASQPGPAAPQDQSISSAPQFQPAGGQGGQQYPAQDGGYGAGPGGMQNQNPYQAGGQSPYGAGAGYQPQGDRKSIKGTPPLWLGITLAALGPILGIIMIIVSIAAMAGAVNDWANAPSGSTHSLEADQDYWVMSGDGTTSVSSCSVYDPDSNSIDVDVTPSTSASGQTEDSSMTLVGTFTSQGAGDYNVYCTGLAGSDTTVVKANIGGFVGGGFGLLGGILIGGLLFLVGIALIIINRVTASRRRRATGFN